MNAKAKDTPTPTPQSKRAAPKPSAETEALRALRQLRQATEREDKARAAYEAVREECIDARKAIHAALSPSARDILGMLRYGADTGALTPAAPGKDS